MDSRYADINGLHLYHEIHGDAGAPLVLLHGGVMTLDQAGPGTVVARRIEDAAVGRRGRRHWSVWT